MKITSDTPRRVFKIATRSAWQEACKEGAFSGSPDDRRDGFIHLSAHHQIAGTLAKHFKGQTDLVLIEFDADALGGDLRWEPSREGRLFPHLFADLPTAAARAIYPLMQDGDGVAILPEELSRC